ncbi:hypothetical protein EW146_g5175 [Bondarzewia mesenterica]|uniref:Uncharacterized protein n=1 Tax=Bondarzewia mesenterica TaxID=1095465 RepID=A0A4S4LSC4_9AGAM|nr:hypothetical protein EW146_g5175 [Bondarzewia mesenterica]
MLISPPISIQVDISEVSVSKLIDPTSPDYPATPSITSSIYSSAQSTSLLNVSCTPNPHMIISAFSETERSWQLVQDLGCPIRVRMLVESRPFSIASLRLQGRVSRELKQERSWMEYKVMRGDLMTVLVVPNCWTIMSQFHHWYAWIGLTGRDTHTWPTSALMDQIAREEKLAHMRDFWGLVSWTRSLFSSSSRTSLPPSISSVYQYNAPPPSPSSDVNIPSV